MLKHKILIIDDEIDFARMVKLNLEGTGLYEVAIETRSVFAYVMARNFVPDLILLDVIMPDAEGPDVAVQLQKDQELRNIPLVFFTATVTREEVAAEDGQIGGRRFLAKPGTLQELIDCIESEISVA